MILKSPVLVIDALSFTIGDIHLVPVEPDEAGQLVELDAGEQILNAPSLMTGHGAYCRLTDHDPRLRAQLPEQLNGAREDDAERIGRMVIIAVQADEIDILGAWP